MGKFHWEGRDKGLPCWLSQFSFAKLGKLSLGNAKKIWYYENWVGRHTSFPPRRSVKSKLFQKVCEKIINIRWFYKIKVNQFKTALMKFILIFQMKN